MGLAFGSVVEVGVGSSAVGVGSCWALVGGMVVGLDMGNSGCWRSSGLGKSGFGRFEHAGWLAPPGDLLGVRRTSGLHDSLILLGHLGPGRYCLLCSFLPSVLSYFRCRCFVVCCCTVVDCCRRVGVVGVVVGWEGWALVQQGVPGLDQMRGGLG